MAALKKITLDIGSASAGAESEFGTRSPIAV
jgi:hypothetical protein